MIMNRSNFMNLARPFYLVLTGLILAAWVLLFAWQNSAYAGLLGHEALEDGSLSPSLHLVAFLLSWLLMVMAMMLPGSLPLLGHYNPPIQEKARHDRPAAWMILAYLVPWTLFGLLAYLGDSALHELAEPGAPLAPFSSWITPAIVLIAGLYQLTPLKRRFIHLCQSPQARLLEESPTRPGSTGPFYLGLRLGMNCLGSCWSLMLFMFALGHNRPDWMVVLGLIMAGERLAPWGYRLSWLVGLALIAWAAAGLLA